LLADYQFGADYRRTIWRLDKNPSIHLNEHYKPVRIDENVQKYRLESTMGKTPLIHDLYAYGEEKKLGAVVQHLLFPATSQSSSEKIIRGIATKLISGFTGKAPSSEAISDGLPELRGRTDDDIVIVVSGRKNDGQVRISVEMTYLPLVNQFQSGGSASPNNEQESDSEDSYAQSCVLGYAYLTGTGVEKNYSTAASLFRKGAEGGHILSMYALANLYDSGKGVPQDYKKAAAWYLQAADRGHAQAQNQLGLYYLIGRGVKLDAAEAYAWAVIASLNGDDNGERKLSSVLTPSQLLVGQRRAEILLEEKSDRKNRQ